MNRFIRIPFFLGLAALLGFGLASCGGSGSLVKSEKELRKEITKRALKEARKEARQYRRDGYMATPGSLPLDKQLQNTWFKILQTDEQGRQAYLHADGNAVAETRTAAGMMALETAKLALAGQMESRITALIKGNIGNSQLNREEAASVSKVLSASKNIIATRLHRVDPTLKMWREVRRSKNVEVNVKIVYAWGDAKEMAKETLRQQLDGEIEDLHKKLDNLLDIDEAAPAGSAS